MEHHRDQQNRERPSIDPSIQADQRQTIEYVMEDAADSNESEGKP